MKSRNEKQKGFFSDNECIKTSTFLKTIYTTYQENWSLYNINIKNIFILVKNFQFQKSILPYSIEYNQNLDW